MNILIKIFTVLMGILLMIVVFRLVIKKKMTESQSVLWILIGAVIIFVGVFPPIVPMIASWLGVWYPPVLLILVAFLGLLAIVFKNTIILSECKTKIYELSIQVSLLKHENEQLKKELEEKREE